MEHHVEDDVPASDSSSLRFRVNVFSTSAPSITDSRTSVETYTKINIMSTLNHSSEFKQ